MSEDELFRKLKRIPYQQLCDEYLATGASPWHTDEFLRFLKERDWTKEEVIKEILKDRKNN